MKQRFSSLDVKVIAKELSEALVTLRLANIYDLSSKILLLKFAKPNTRQQLLVDSGFRCHLTSYARTSAAAPSLFVAHLRKFLRTRRVTSVSQIGTDRTIEFQFSDGAYRLYLEFFASGNVILTDSELKILTLLRNVHEGEGQEPQRVGLIYRLDNRQNVGGIPPLTKERVEEALKTTVARTAAATAAQVAGKKTKKRGSDELRRGLATTITELPPVLLDHVFRVTQFDPTTQPSLILQDESLLDALFQSLQKAREIVEGFAQSTALKGYIIAKPKSTPNPPQREPEETTGENSRDLLLYEDFHPFLPSQFEDDKTVRVLSFDGFNKTVDEFFSSVEGQKLESRLGEREAAAKRKLDAAKRDQEKRIEGLQEVQTLNLRKAAAIEANIERVQEAMDAVKGLLDQGMDWDDINLLVQQQQQQHNPVARIIKLPVKLAENTVTLIVGEEEEHVDDELDSDYDSDEDSGPDGEEAADDKSEAARSQLRGKSVEVDIKLDLSPWANASEYYDQKRTAADKEQKTVQQSAIALKNAEQKIAENLKKELKQEKPVLSAIRKQFWFEKFTWFISSDGYLVLGGRDAQQNEMLYRRHLKKGDVYVHADLHGAPSVIIKNNPRTPDAPIPPSTLAQAGNLAVCASGAWDSKAAMSAWWVAADQVSKSAPAGEFLPTGSFMVRGKRNFLPPAQLVLGFGLLFKISDESKARHVKHRLYDDDDNKNGDAANSAAASNAVQPTEAANISIGDDDGNGAEVDDSDEDDDGDDEEDAKQANPLQPSTVHNHDGGDPEEQEQNKAMPEDGDVPPPSKEVSNLQLSSEPLESEQAEREEVEKDEMGDEEEEEGSAEQGQEGSATITSSATQTSHTRTPSTAPSQTASPSTPAQQKKGPAKRGQRGKAKRIATKYRDQDDEDRLLMERLNGVEAGRQKAAAEAAARAQREAENAAARERRRQHLERQKREVAAHEEARRAMMLDEGVEEVLDEAEAVQATALDALVGTPLPGDEILEAVPVCAPWAALARVKYRAKLQPGALKKGKAVRDIVERWRSVAARGKGAVIDEAAADAEKMWPREVELIRALKVEEALNCVPVGKVTVMMSGGALGGGNTPGKGGGQGKKGGGGGSNKGGGKGKKK